MDKEKVRSALSELCGMLVSIRKLMDRLGPVPVPEELERALHSRRIILESISSHISLLDHLDLAWREKISEYPDLAELGRKFQFLAEKTAENDAVLVSGIRKRMSSIQEELKNITVSSNAAVSYAAHSML
ncbi:MAG: hypothetical protein GF350_16800 [Chitinivibrionales bacterium]|nr:hypothetical protein [Chitinivibrionales bacterium]